MSQQAQQRTGIVAQHGRAIVEIAGVSALGIIASAAFQIITVRGLGPAEFGLLASFIALVNVASIGSGALRNSVAVATAAALHTGTVPSAPRRGRWDASLVEAWVLGALGTVGVLVFALVIAPKDASGLTAAVITASVITPYFLFARAQGRIQGVGDSRSVVWWSTGAQLAQAALALLVILLGGGASLVLVVLLLTAVVGAVGASLQGRRTGAPVAVRPFTMETTVVLLLTIGFAWLTNADVVFVRGGAAPELAGAYAAAAVLIKTTLVIPTTFSLYLLPRFVKNRTDAAMTNLGVNVILGATLACGVLMAVVVAFFGEPIVRILYGQSYADTAPLLVGFALAWIPWALAQGILVRITAAASKLGLIAIVVAAGAQWVLAATTLPDITAWLVANGLVGTFVFLCLYGTHWLLIRRGRRSQVRDDVARL